MRYKIGDIVRVNFNNYSRPILVAKILEFARDPINYYIVDILVGVIEPKNFKGHCGNHLHQERYESNWKDKCYFIFENDIIGKIGE